jgi:hypothetical protein
VWFADWAEEQIDGLHGGSKAREYFNRLPPGVGSSDLGWLYFGLGYANRLNNPIFAFMLTSDYQPPALVDEIAHATAKRAPYVVMSRRPGLFDTPGHLDAKAGGILRYTFVAPSFVMGSAMYRKLPLQSWSPASSQNRWSGVVLAGSPERYVFASPVLETAKDKYANIYNSEWMVQHKGVQIIQKLPRSFSGKSGPMTIWIGKDLNPERKGAWLFFNSSAYVAVRPVFGDLKQRDDPWGFILTMDYSPIILVAGDKQAFGSFEQFQQATMAAALKADQAVVTFQPPQSTETIRFFPSSGRAPEVNGKPVDVDVPYWIDSPFIKSKWGEGVVTITFDGETLVRDFRQ